MGFSAGSGIILSETVRECNSDSFVGGGCRWGWVGSVGRLVVEGGR